MFARCSFFLLFFYSSLHTLTAQETLSIIDENAVWVERYIAGDGNGYYVNNLSVITIKGDTIISDTTYSKLYRNNKFQGGLREEGKKVFYRPSVYLNTSFQDQLIYDFSLSLGDTITLNCLKRNSGVRCKRLVVLKVDTIVLNDNQLRKRQHMKVIRNYLEPVNYNVYWIEGIGSQQALLEDDFCYFFDLEKFGPLCGQRLVCYSLNGQMLYSNSDSSFQSCPPPFIVGANYPEILQDVSIQLFPNPSSIELSYEINSSVRKHTLEEINILNLYGKNVLHLKNGAIKQAIDISRLSKGLFLITFKFSEGRVIKRFVKN